MSRPIFVAAWFSPWSERARFALDHHRIDYHEESYVPLLGEPLLRLRTRVFRGQLSVPVLLHDGRVIRDSVEIARHADRVGTGSPLFPASAEAEIARYVELATGLMEAARVLSMPRMANDPAVRRESLPSFVPTPLRSALLPLAGLGAAYVARKYRLGSRDPNEARATMRRALERLQAELRGRSTLLSDFTFADIAAAVALTAVRPVEHPVIPLGPGMRAAFTDQEMAKEFGELLAWRDRLYAERRSTPGTASA
ncbi:glutathione S-transferase family protein [Archangium sp.]|uniref:glutathione S-transferase family protein n=1 Tax=Archangium sp. TaxID=1872627 RepID=UPI002D5954AB|nr:glutathione S-transferase N-terminal domain-containing protein [Archangium sp.]HYO53788.1 glutathione S-transferase N-terminal domain-containing protein [Archangium sp.]